MKYIPLSLNLEDTWSIIHLWTYTTLFSITAAMSVLHWSSCCSHFSLGLGASTMMSFLSPFLKTLASITFSLGSLTMQMVNMIGIWQILNMFWSRYGTLDIDIDIVQENIPSGQSSAKLPVTRSLSHSVTQSLSHSVTLSLHHSFIRSLFSTLSLTN